MKCLSSFTENSVGGIVPNGFKVIIHKLRCVLLVYADNQIRTLKFDDISTAVEGNLPFQKAYDYAFEGSAAIRTIISSSGNTFGLLDNGRIFYFVSFRAVEVIPSIKNVRAICESESGFALIRNASPTDVFIELYTDRSSNEMLKKYKKISIGWDETWSFERDQEMSVLLLIRLDREEVVEVFSHFVDPEETIPEGGYSNAVVFSINCSLFCIFYENAKDVQSGVNPIRTFLSEVQSIHFCDSGIMCVILATGVISLLYVDYEKELDEASIFLGLDEIQAVECIEADNCLYISDRRECVKVILRIASDPKKDVEAKRVQWTVERINLLGVVGISYLPSIGSVLFLTENNFIYAIEHRTSANQEIKDITEDGLAVNVLHENLLALSTTNQEVHKEAVKSTAINVALNPEVVRDNCQVDLSFKSNHDYYEMPSLADKRRDQLYDISLEFTFQPELEKIFRSGRWTINVVVRRSAEDCHQETIELDEEFLKRRKVKLLRSSCRNTETIGADFEITVQGFVDSAEKLLIDVPLKVAYNLESLVEVLEEDPMEMTGKYKFTIRSEDKVLLGHVLDLIIEQRMKLEPFVIGIGHSAIVASLEEFSCKFMSDDQTALQLLKKILLLEGHNRGIWSEISYEPKETIAVRRLLSLFD